MLVVLLVFISNGSKCMQVFMYVLFFNIAVLFLPSFNFNSIVSLLPVWFINVLLINSTIGASPKPCTYNAYIAWPLAAVFLMNSVLYIFKLPSSITEIAPPRPVPLLSSIIFQQLLLFFSNFELFIVIWYVERWSHAPIAPPPLSVVQLFP